MSGWLMDYDDESYGGSWSDFYGDYIWDDGKWDCDDEMALHDNDKELTFECAYCGERHNTDAGYAMDLLYADVLPMRPYYSFFGEIPF